MASAIFEKPFNFTPKGMGKSWKIDAGEGPQTFPKHVIAAAVKAGVAKEVEGKPKAATK